MDRAFQVGIAATLIRFLIFGGIADVLALLIATSAYFLNKYTTITPIDTEELTKIKSELEEVKSQMSSVSLAMGFKKKL